MGWDFPLFSSIRPSRRLSPGSIYQPSCHMQPLLRRVIGHGAAIRQDQPQSSGLADSRYHFVFKLDLAAVSEGTTLPQTTHQAFVRERQGLAETGTSDAIAPTHYGDGVICEILEVNLVTALVRIGMDMDNVETALLCTLSSFE